MKTKAEKTKLNTTQTTKGKREMKNSEISLEMTTTAINRDLLFSKFMKRIETETKDLPKKITNEIELFEVKIYSLLNKTVDPAEVEKLCNNFLNDVNKIGLKINANLKQSYNFMTKQKQHKLKIEQVELFNNVYSKDVSKIASLFINTTEIFKYSLIVAWTFHKQYSNQNNIIIPTRESIGKLFSLLRYDLMIYTNKFIKGLKEEADLYINKLSRT